MSDAQLVSAAQAALSSSGRGDDHVLAALAVSTRAPDTLASLLTGAPRPDKRRVVALSVRPPAEGEGGGGGGGSWGAHIHTLKAAAFGGLTPIDRRNLRRLARLEGGPADADGRQRAAGLAFGSLSGATREELLLPTPEARAFLLGALWWLRAKFPSNAPPLQLSGLSSIQLRGWAEDAKAACRLPTGEEEEREEDEGGGADGGWGEPGGGLDGGAGPLSRAGSLRKGAHQRPRLVSDAEAAALQSLLDSYKLDIGQAGALEERLTREAAALEAANVNALLQSDVDLAAVMHLLRLAESELEDTGQWLGVFTVKLAHMRGDMRAIEARSRTLQRQAANNAAVRAPLAALVAATAPAGRLEKELAGPVVGPSAGTALGAAGRLAERIAGLSEPPLPPGTASMRAVVETAASLGALRSGFVARGVGAARASIAAAHDAVAPAQPSATAQQGASQQQQPQQQPPRVADTSPAKRGLAELRPLVDALVRLDGPSSYPPLRSAFVAAAGGMLRRCGRDFGAAARAACKDGDKGGGGSGVVPPGAPRPLPPHALFGIGVHALLRAAGDVCGAGAELLWRPPEAPPVAAGDDEPQHGHHHHHHHHHHRSHSHADNGHAAAANGHGGGGAAAAPPAGASAAPAPGGPTLASACAALFDALAPELASLAEWASKGDGGAAALAVAGAARRAGAAAGGGGGAAAPSAVHASASSSSLSGLAAASAAAAGAAPQPAAAAAAAQALSLAEAMDASLSRLVADRLAALRRVSPSSSSAFGGDAAPGASGGSAASSSSRLGGLISARAALIGGGAAGHHPPHEPLAEIVATAALVKRLHALAAEAPAPAESGADGAGDRKAARRAAAAAAAAQPASDGRREAADAACGSLVSCCLAAAKRAAAADPDHAAEITLRHAAILAAVAASCDAASPALISATSAAVASSLASYGDALLRRSPAFGPVLALADAIDSALGAGLSPDAAALRPGLTKGEARKALKDALGARRAERGIADAHSRVVKHFGGSGGGVPPTLVADAWAAARGLLLERYARLEGNVAAMYGDAVQPGAGELEELFKTV